MVVKIYSPRKANRRKSITPMYVLASKSNASDYRRLKNVSAFLKGNDFYDLQAGPSKRPKLSIGLPMKL
jgi:hypothetical protein